MEVVEAVEVIEAAEVLRSGKSLLRALESSRFLNSALFWCLDKILICSIHDISYWNLPPFLSVAVEASWCYFLENWLMKLKCPLLLKSLATIVEENSQSLYPSEPFRIIHFTMRHPVVCWVHRTVALMHLENAPEPDSTKSYIENNHWKSKTLRPLRR